MNPGSLFAYLDKEVRRILRTKITINNNKTMGKINNYINHIAFVLDASSSMRNLCDKVITVCDNQIQHLAARSKELDQETRVSVYSFADTTRNIIFDKDALRTPSIKNHYSPNGNTALIDATIQAINDLKQTAQLYGDHAFLVYVQTDGEENRSRATSNQLSELIKSLPENWTIAALVPNQSAVFETKKFGFPANNIQVWSTDAVGVEKAGVSVQSATDQFMQNRSLGIRGTKNLFNLDDSKLTKSTVTSTLKELPADSYKVFKVEKKVAIKPFVESWTKEYRLGSAYYQLNKPEKIQPGKIVIIRNKLNGRTYTGPEARQLLGLPDHEVKVNPVSNKDFDIFVKSTSVNRWLVPGTELIVVN